MNKISVDSKIRRKLYVEFSICTCFPGSITFNRAPEEQKPRLNGSGLPGHNHVKSSDYIEDSSTETGPIPSSLSAAGLTKMEKLLQRASLLLVNSQCLPPAGYSGGVGGRRSVGLKNKMARG